ncbi:MAG TPA: PDZ domain-containing protein [Gemmatimonadales bacterium]|nr:PDZ domain-containing protein [Gemmatimonadales bacterium]
MRHRARGYRGVAAVAAALLAIPAGVGAQEGPRRGGQPEAAPPRDRAEIVITRRARLGLKVNLQARQTDSTGAYVDLVTPGGPADVAGLRAGDVITQLDGQSLNEGSRTAQPGRSLPGLRLIRLAARLDPGDTVAVEYLRGAERRRTSLVTGDDHLVHLEQHRIARGIARAMDGVAPWIQLRDSPAYAERRFEFPAPAFELFLAGDLGELELAPLNPDLGQYFGTGDGVLVISAPKGSPLRLRGGDVVLAVDGRRPAGPPHLLRILRSYDGGETFTLEIMRNRRRERMSASINSPESADR